MRSPKQARRDAALEEGACFGDQVLRTTTGDTSELNTVVPTTHYNPSAL
jgi:hypothetical protein